MSRTTFECYKKVDGLRWQCTNCVNEIEGIWTKLDELTALVNEINSKVNLSGIVKAAVGEVLRENVPIVRASNSPANLTVNPVCATVNKKKNRCKRKNKKSKSSTPVNGSVTQPNSSAQLTPSRLESSSSTLDITVVPAVETVESIRMAEKRTYIWLNGFHHETTTSQVIKLVATTMDVRESDVICRSLKSGRRTYTESDQISFRVGLRSSDVKDVLTTNRWPKGVVCKLFKSKNSSARNPVILD